MARYSKLIGTIVGGLLGFAVSLGFLPEGFDTQTVTAAVVTVASAIGAFFAPKNAD